MVMPAVVSSITFIEGVGGLGASNCSYICVAGNCLGIGLYGTDRSNASTITINTCSASLVP